MKVSFFGLMVLASLSWPTSLTAQIVQGQVVDSVTNVPLDGVSVMLLDASGLTVDSATTNPDGRFLLYAVNEGEYRLHAVGIGYRASTFPGFPLTIDSVKGFQLLLSSLVRTPRVTATEIVKRVCADGAVQAGEGVILGRVLNIQGEPVGDAEVVVSWPLMSSGIARFVQGDVLEDVAAAIATDSSGFYAACGVPFGATVRFHATRGDELSVLAAVEFVEGGVMSAGDLHETADRIWVRDLVLTPPTGRTALLRGTVLSTEGTPIVGADVQLALTRQQTETDSRGSFVLNHLPAGSAKLSVRAVGYRAKEVLVELVEGETVVLDAASLQLDGAPTELAPISVEATAPETRRMLEEFEDRRSRTTGMFTTRAEFVRQGNPQIPTDVLRRMGGIKIEVNPGYSGASDTPRYLIVMNRAASRGSFGNTSSGRSCAPLAFLDGNYLGRTNSVDIDGVINLDHIEAIEAYASVAGMPQEFNRPGATCGVVAFWSR